jgi:RecB family exonuclease
MDLRLALEHAIRTLRAGNPFLQIAVVVPNHLLGVWLSRSIFKDTGHMAIEFVLAHELAWKLAAPSLLREGRACVPENVGLAVLLAAIPEAVANPGTPEYLREAVKTAGFAPAALRTIEDLAGANLRPEHLETEAPTAADPERLRLVARLWRAFEAGLEKARLLDRARLYGAAARVLPSELVGAVVLCGSDDPSPAEGAFLEALGTHHPLALLAEASTASAPRHASRQQALAARVPKALAVASNRQSSKEQADALARLKERLFAPAQPAATTTPRGSEVALDTSVHILSAAGEALEAVEIARLIQQAAAQGTRYQDVAVLLRSPDAYNVAFASAFERAGIDAFFVEGVPEVDPAARGLSLLLELVGANLDRARVMEFLTSARIRWANVLGPEAEISPARWDRLSAQAGIVGGLESWRSRLAQKKQDREAREYDDDRDLRLYDSLIRLIERLAGDLATIPAAGSWGAFLDATLALLDAWIDRAALTRERLERVLRPLAEYAPAPSREEFLVRVRELLATQRYREGQLGDGRVFVGSIDSARGLRFRVVFVPGLVERAFPGLVRPDPLLLDEEREALSPDLRTTRDGQEAERLRFVEAVRAAEQRLVLSYPRFDTASGRERVPSSFLLKALEAALGKRIDTGDLARLASPGATALGRPHPEDPAQALDRIERDLALVSSGQPGVARHLAQHDSFLVRSLQQERASWEAALTPWDGIVDVAGSEEALARLRLAGQRSSASVVETFAACPYRHFLKTGLRLRAWEEPERAYQAEPKDFGSLYHAVAHRLFAELKEQGRLPLAPDAPDQLAERIGALVDDELARFAAEGGIVNAALLDPIRVRLRSDIEEMLRDEIESAADGFVPEAFEQEFDGVEVALGSGEAVSFRGKIDRLDVAAGARRVRVIDYKTGGHYWKREEEWKGGRELQLALYNRAARRLFPDHAVAEAVYYYATAKGEYKRKGRQATTEVDETLTHVLKTLDDLAAAGVFPPVADTCMFCDFQAVCGPFREARAARKSGDPRLAAFKRLREIP